jgi:uncharacterized protein YerC
MNNNYEIYKAIPGYPNYEVSNQGNVKSLKYNIILKPQIIGSGYLMVDLCKNGTKQRFLVHRIVLSTFKGFQQDKNQVNHINGNKLDNRLVNLEWNTRSENQKHSILIGLRHTRGENNSQSKLNEKNVISILNDQRPYKQISKEYNVSIPTISDIKRGFSWTHITKLNNKKH